MIRASTAAKRAQTRTPVLIRTLLFLACVLFAALSAQAQDEAVATVGEQARSLIDALLAPEGISDTLKIFLLVTVLSLAPAILVMTTSFTRIIVVFGFLRQAMATQQSPPNQVLIGMALILTAFIMRPVYTEAYEVALEPYINGEITDGQEAWELGLKPLRDFMFRQTGERELLLFINLANLETPPESIDDVPTVVLMSAFVLSEMNTAFKIGFLIYIPFLIIDMVVASTLMAMGMMMLPPVFVSLPFKIILFVLADGWGLLVVGLVESFN